MAAPIFSAAINKLGRTIYRKAGRFVSEQTYNRGVSAGKGFVKRLSQNKTQPNIAKTLMDTIGPPIGGGNWVSRVRRSSERFTELLGDNNELG